MEKQTRTSDEIAASPVRRGPKPGANASGMTAAQPVTPVASERSQGAAKRSKKSTGLDRGERRNRIDNYFGTTIPPREDAAEESKQGEGEKEGGNGNRNGEGSGEEANGSFRVNLEGMDTTQRMKNQRRQATKSRLKEAAAAAQKKKVTAKKKVKGKEGTKKDAAQGPTKPAPVPKHKAVVSFAFRIGQGRKTKANFDTKIGESLTFLHNHVDEAACFLPKKGATGFTPIRQKADIPSFQITLRKKYMDIPSPYAFSAIIQESGRVIKGSATMGFDVDPKEALEEAFGDLQNMGITLTFKPCQELDTNNEQCLLGAPNTIDVRCVKKILDKELAKIEEELKGTEGFPNFRHDKTEWINFGVIKQFPDGMPWERQSAGTQRQPNGRNAFAIQCAQYDYARLESLLAVAKERGVWKDYWGPCAYTVRMPDNNLPKGDPKEFTEGQKALYIHMVQNHGSAQLSYGGALITGLFDAETSYELRRMPGRDGKPRAPTNKSIRDVFRAMTIGDTDQEGDETEHNLWVCLSKGHGNNGVYTGYFMSTVVIVRLHVSEFIKCPAANVFWYLLRQGCKKEDVIRMIRGTFTIEEQQKVSNSRWSKSRMCAIVNAGEMDDICAAVKAAGIDTTLGLSDKEKREYMGRLPSELDINFSDLKDGAVEAHAGDAPSVQTLKGRVAKDDASTIASQSLGGKSIYEVGGDSNEESEEGSNDEEEDSVDEVIPKKRVNFQFDPEATKTTFEGDDFMDATSDKEDVEDDKTENMDDIRRNMQDNLNKAQEELDNDPMNRSNDGMEDDPLRNTDSEDEVEEGRGKGGDPDSDADYEAWEKMWGRKFENPGNFKEQLWNDSGPSLGAMNIYVNAVLEELVDEELFGDWEKKREKHPFISDELREYLENEAGTSREEQQDFLMEVLDDLAELEGMRAPESDGEQDQHESDEDASIRAQPHARIGAHLPATETAGHTSQEEEGQGDDRAVAEPDQG